jgi:hypothetical protein
MRLKTILPVGFFLLSLPFAWAQKPGGRSSNQQWLDLGMISGNSYDNECLGLWFPIPDGWEIGGTGITTPGKATHLANGGLGLLHIYQRANFPIGNWIDLNAFPATGSAVSPRDFVTSFVHKNVASNSKREEILQDGREIVYAGRQFFRSNYQQTLSDGGTLYHSAVYTKFRGYFIGESVIAGSPGELDRAVYSLSNIAFQQDKINPDCVMGPDEMLFKGVVRGVISETPRLPPPKSTQPR